MTTFAIKCPHCLRDNTSFTVDGVRERQGQENGWNDVETFATCNACGRGVVGTVSVHPPHAVANSVIGAGTLQTGPHIRVREWLPKSPTPDIPDHLPESVLKAFSEAEHLRIAGFRSPAGNAYRRALEAGLREVDPALKGPLYARIEALANRSLLTPSMRDFAHRIRTLGNEASHETPVVDDDEIDSLAIFTTLVLMYQFTLPGMLPKLESEALTAVRTVAV